MFDVDLDDGGKMKLPYNLTEDPWFAAQAFIHRNNLSQYYLDQVANFIVRNTKAMMVESGPAPATFADPFTGNPCTSTCFVLGNHVGRYCPEDTECGMDAVVM